MKLNQLAPLLSQELSQARRFKIAAIAPLTLMLLGSYLTLNPQRIAQAKPTLDPSSVAQRVDEDFEEGDELPPDIYNYGLPPFIYGQELPPGFYQVQPPVGQYDQGIPPGWYNNQLPPSRYSVNPSSGNPYYLPGQGRYLVYINDHDRNLLAMVRRIVPNAVIRSYQGRNVIQVGVFDDRREAQQVMRTLEQQLIDAEIVTVGASWNNYGYPNYGVNVQPSVSQFYFVSIPTREADLPFVANTVRQLLSNFPCGREICLRNSSQGYNVLVGPFPSQNVAAQWQRYLRDYGLRNARVYSSR